MEQALTELLQEWGIEKATIAALYGELDLNFKVTANSGEFVLKLFHPDRDDRLLSAQDDLLEYLASKNTGFETPVPLRDIHGDLERKVTYRGISYKARLLHWIPGKLWSELGQVDTVLVRSLGRRNGQLASSLSGYNDPRFQRELNWIPSNPGWIAQHIPSFDNRKKSILKRTLEVHQDVFEHHNAGLRKSLVYMDANDNNILVRQADVGFPGRSRDNSR